MPKVQQPIPDKIKPYQFHGVHLDWQRAVDRNEHWAMGNCPLCSREGKFGVCMDGGDRPGMFKCLKCGENGSAITFLRWLHDQSVSATTEYHSLSVDRKLLNGGALVQWGVCRSILTDDWLIPGYNIDGKLCQLYRYMKVVEDGKKRMAAILTPTLGHQLFGVNLWKPDNLVVFVCEGWSDGVALWEVMSQTKEVDGEWHPTSNVESSLLADSNVIATATCTTFFESFCPLFAGKIVNLMFDNDHPRTHAKTGKPIAPAGLDNMKRIARMLHAAKEPPETINLLKWCNDDWVDRSKPTGHDLRDELTYA